MLAISSQTLFSQYLDVVQLQTSISFVLGAIRILLVRLRTLPFPEYMRVILNHVYVRAGGGKG